MKLKRAIALGLLMIFSVVGLAMGGQNNNRRDRRGNNRMERRDNGNRHNGNWQRKHRRHRRERHRRRGMRM